MLMIKVFPLGPLDTNSHVLHTKDTAVLIDVGKDPAPIIDYLEKENLTLEAVYLTHLHFDHIYGLSELLKTYPVPVYVSEDDVYLLESALLRPGQYGLPPLIVDYTFNFIKEGKISILGEEVDVIHTPGHTLGSLSYYIPSNKALFTGDVLFYQTIGRTDLPGGNLPALHSSIKDKLFSLPSDTVVYPGHDRTTTIGYEKKHNPALRTL